MLAQRVTRDEALRQIDRGGEAPGLLMRGDVLIPRGVWEPDGDGLLIGKESR